MSTSLYCLAISVIHVTLGAGPLCFECNDIPSPQTCQYITRCGEHEDCSVESVVTSGGLALYNVGCRPKTSANNLHKTNHFDICGHHVNWSKSELEYYIIIWQCVEIKRNIFSIKEDTSTDLITCVKCCTNGDFCNREGCGSIDVPRGRRGPYCYNCDVQSNTTACRKVTLCGPDDVCVLEPNKFPPYTYYTSHCSQKEKCQTSLTHDHSSTCSVCCDSDFCNNHCNQSGISISPVVTTKSPSTAMATASSVKTTPAVINHTTTTRTTMRTMTITTVTKSISTRAPDHACSGADYFQTNITHLCIKIHREAVNFTTAERKCQNEHAHLVQIDNVLKVIDIARNLAHSHDSRYYWIGLADIYHNKSLYWLNREPMTYNNFLQHSLHTMHLSTGFAVTLDSTYRRNIWTATNAENLSGFICEMPVASSVNLNQSINAVCNGSEGFQMDSSGSACVKMVTDIRLTWIDALSYCKKIKSHFVILSDHHKHEEVMEIIGDKNLVYDFWFGLHAVNGTWYWGSSSRVQWTKWQSGHPGAYQESDACAVLWQSEWFATSCNDTRHFICERYIL